MANQVHTHNGRCYCGQVQVEVEGDTVFEAYCHCDSCRRWHSAPMAALAAWPESSVKVRGDVVVSVEEDECQRTSCARCGGSVLTTKPGLRWKVVYPSTLAGSDFKYRPGLHVHYAERVLDINDSLPKFADVPKEAGGTGALIEEPAASGWRR